MGGGREDRVSIRCGVEQWSARVAHNHQVAWFESRLRYKAKVIYVYESPFSERHGFCPRQSVDGF